ncbi:Predicted DNA-binding protein with PD1-like DNA-binding motif [Desulfonispora thiosulfatigenes DSM 11270]|uniref:Predicted DNA-binding protein with PD1-like DNA-binding motif n=1 Tax=Desulfonispora thiosulfatigenes DSM 11270 TaxID=656914 RepID=A0A1W1UL20_DESTI|nr:PPC domain-containing DNA-binding protein [Desulfonispora thiosulfatigenes]SMB81719.1 Predicted DNA-binding protein with PD1-like DNA-binding motif [Desulfonispora thiosulfatigenes DSM 11270]
MKYTEANLGRIFILRLEEGDQIPRTIEKFAKDKNINSATVLFIGGAKKDSKIVVGPKDCEADKPVAIVEDLLNTSETIGVGTIFTNEETEPRLHLHASFGSHKGVVTGCTRQGVDIWLVGEVVILEMINHSGTRKVDASSGFELLEV